MSMLKKLLIRLTGNYFSQRLLENISLQLQHLVGIGSGAGVFSSGEAGVFNLLKEGHDSAYCIFDVGANKGQFLTLTRQCIDTESFSIHCFEPGHGTFTALKKSAMDDRRVILNNFGLGKESGEFTLHYDVQGSGLASLTKRNLSHLDIPFDESEKVNISTVDVYCEEHKITHIHLLKIDVEGHELDVLKGAEKMFRSNSIAMVSFEFGGCNIDTRTFFRDFWIFFSRMNMKIFRITPSGYFLPIKFYNEAYEQFRTTNFIALKNDIRN